MNIALPCGRVIEDRLRKVANTRRSGRIQGSVRSRVSRARQEHNTLVFQHLKCDRFNSDPQIGVGLRQAPTCNLRSEFRCSMCPAIHTNSRI